MISLKEIIEKFKFEPLSSVHSLERQVTGGYASDLLSWVIKGAAKDWVWVTLQSHLNVVAVASLLGLSGVIITEGNRPDPEGNGKKRYFKSFLPLPIEKRSLEPSMSSTQPETSCGPKSGCWLLLRI